MEKPVTITATSEKGGVGKTFFSVNFGYYSASTGKKTILIDADHQGNASTWILPDIYQNSKNNYADNVIYNYELADVLLERAELEKAIYQISENFFILPTFPTDKDNSDLKSYAEGRLSREEFIFKILNGYLRDLGFEVIVYDTNPGMNMFELAVLKHCTEVILPLELKTFSTVGVAKINSIIKNINRDPDRNVKMNKLIMNKIDNRFSYTSDNMKKIEKINMLQYKISTTEDYEKAVNCNMSIFDYNKKNKIIPELQRLYNDILENK